MESRLYYGYRTECGKEFVVNSLAAVGKPYQQWFHDAIKSRGWVVETRRLEQAPFVADFLIAHNEGTVK